jgi:hypothetical protein
MRLFIGAFLGLSLATAGLTRAEAPRATPLPVPLTRPEMKQSLEDLKKRTPRIPLPALTEEELALLGERGAGYEARLRFHYMPPGEGQRGGFSREPDPRMSLDYRFKTMLFWIVSRTNNCHY